MLIREDREDGYFEMHEAYLERLASDISLEECQGFEDQAADWDDFEDGFEEFEDLEDLDS